MKKIIIIVVIAAALAGAAVLLIVGKNDVVSADVTMDISQVTVDKFSSQDERDAAIMANRQKNAETNVVTLLNDGSVSAVDSLTKDERDIIVRIDKENRIADVLSYLDWVDHAEVSISGSDKDLFAAAVLTVNRELSSDDADDAAYVISRYVENADILITDQNANVIYPFGDQ